MHVPVAHTDGEAVVHFRKADAIHMDDVYFNGRFVEIVYRDVSR